jgi:hypothetical protein
MRLYSVVGSLDLKPLLTSCDMGIPLSIYTATESLHRQMEILGVSVARGVPFRGSTGDLWFLQKIKDLFIG